MPAALIINQGISMEGCTVKPRRSVLLFISLGLLIASCSNPTVEVLHGNYRYSRGEYARATISYIRALETGREEALVSYDLGNVYNSLGETEAAREALAPALSQQESENLLYRAHFNLGNISYEEGDFEAAVKHFIEALKARPNEVDAKINLELSLEKMEANVRKQRINVKSSIEDLPLEDSYSEILRFVKQREEYIWKSLKKTEQEDTEEDW